MKYVSFSNRLYTEPKVPKFYSVTSEGPAATHHQQSMGIYVRLNKEGYNNSPVYKKHLMEKFIFLAESGNWMISSTLGGNVGNIFQESGSFPLPLDHVEWFSASPDQDAGFEIDRTLNVTPKGGKLFINEILMINSKFKIQFC